MKRGNVSDLKKSEDGAKELAYRSQWKVARFYWGIDPGKSGAIAFIDDEGKLRGGKLLKNTDHDIYNWLTQQLGKFHQHDHVCVLEKVWGFPKYKKSHKFICSGCGLEEEVDIETPQGGSSTFAFGVNFGLLKGLLAATGVSYREVAPASWKRHMSLTLKKGSTVTQRKNTSKAMAQQLFPKVKVTHATAEALLIAEFCRRTWP